MKKRGVILLRNIQYLLFLLGVIWLIFQYLPGIFNGAANVFAVTIQGGDTVVDEAEIISQTDEGVLEQTIAKIQRNTTAEIAIVTMEDLDGRDSFHVAMNLARHEDSEIDYTWNEQEGTGVGDARYNNGIVVLVAPNEREWQIVVGEGLEGAVPDALAKRYGEEILVSSFRQERYAEGLFTLLQAFSGAIAGEADAWEEEITQSSAGLIALTDLFVIFMIMIFFLGPVLKRFLETDREKYIGSGVGTGLMSIIAIGIAGWIAFWLVIPLGLTRLLVLFGKAKTGGGGFHTGGFGSGGSSFGGGGGFSSFGGGSFAGGGAGGSR